MNQQLASLCRELQMPESVTQELLALLPGLDLPALQPAMDLLFREEGWEQGLSGLKQLLGEDPRGIKMLLCHLLCALKTRETYRQLAIPDEIFLATMDCFPRFVKEHLVSFGCYGFDRDFWTVHQLSAVLFRVGLLEFELREKDVSLHIPSGAHLQPEAVTASLAAGNRMIAEFFPRWDALPRVCHSWLLSPTLLELLPENSNILQFQKRFSITPTGLEDRDFLLWAFQNRDIPYAELPENTSLQRKLKAHLLQGKPFLDARGQLIS